MKILAIGAHPDDIEIFMYGMLSVYLNRGDEIYMIVVTDGSAGDVLAKSNLAKLKFATFFAFSYHFGNEAKWKSSCFVNLMRIQTR